MSVNSKTVLKSKLAVYTFCYQEAKKANDLKRMDLLGVIISDLQDEIETLEED
mgnify:CR=1 FL=1